MNFSCCSRLEHSLMKMIKWCIGGLHLCCMSRQGEVFWFGRRSAELRLHPVSEHFHLEWCHLVCCRSDMELAACLSGLQGWMHAGLTSAPAVLVNASVYLCGAESSSPVKLLGFRLLGELNPFQELWFHSY